MLDFNWIHIHRSLNYIWLHYTGYISSKTLFMVESNDTTNENAVYHQNPGFAPRGGNDPASGAGKEGKKNVKGRAQQSNKKEKAKTHYRHPQTREEK
jgi:hypothetical protein